ncbi:MAG TPA: hypothetical protein VHG92_03850 [Afifellaceae bacterium]|nr:hypothetical protein [Afifellaceae bacterium]
MSDLLARVAASKELTRDVALEARRSVYNDGTVEPGEVEFLFALDEAAERRDPAWIALFSEAIVDYLVHQQPPSGYVSEENADWLVARISRDGLVTTETELEVLAKVLESARSSPSRLSAFALGQVKAAVLEGRGPLACGRALAPGRVGGAEADLMRRILYAFGGDGNIAITRPEAEVLFDINDATAAAENDPAWTDLFVKAVANCLMAASGYEPPSRQVALRREEWLDSNGGGVGDFFGRMLAGGLRGALQAYREPDIGERWAERNQRHAMAAATAERLSQDEAVWLAARIGRDGVLHDNEKALLGSIRAESPHIHPALQPLLEQAA